MASLKDHWNKKYTDTPIAQLGWYESKSQPSLQLIENCAVLKDAIVVDVGSGASALIANLLELGYQNLYAVDISDVALEKAKALLDQEQAARVHWIVDDITNPSAVLQIQNVKIWHDRAVFHFLTEEQDRQTYKAILEKTVMSDGYVIMAAFALNGATICSGLPVQRHSVESLREFFGDGFNLIESLDYTFHNPSGDTRPYVYTRFQKI
ncbi:class I SAM-dependent methyltransferase [Candidatus Villigracilis affinis]|uniref:class I SAM-dependent methyltransferase n=1 Tax=Candidatus Villigracilis affinis TaxID=3140682 RepID=UPI001E0EC444|nr:class I SAM-dependent methyltransferase [Anaerolineales bacterium]